MCELLWPLMAQMRTFFVCILTAQRETKVNHAAVSLELLGKLTQAHLQILSEELKPTQ